MIFVRVIILAIAAGLAHGECHAGSPPDETPSLTEKINAYVECINRLSERAYDSRSRYFSWVGKNGPTGKERIIYGTYTIYDTADCKATWTRPTPSTRTTRTWRTRPPPTSRPSSRSSRC